MPEQTVLVDPIDEELALSDKQLEDEDDVSQVSQNIISFTQLYSIETLYNKLTNTSLWIPEFQRKWWLWSLKNQSLFIESIILNLPIPSIVVFTDSSNKLKVIDGLQRTSTLKSFLNDWFRLSSLAQVKTEQFNGLLFSELSEDIKNQIRNSTISVITVQCSPDDEKAEATYYEIFRRLNQGWLALTPQEIRNAIYKWPFLDFVRGIDDQNIVGIRNNVIWTSLYKIRWNQVLNYQRERDVELLLKIFALAENADDKIGKNMGDFLNDYLKRANKKTDEEIKTLDKAFTQAMEYIEANNIIGLFRERRVRQSMWYNMLLSVVITYYLANPTLKLDSRDFINLLNQWDLPNASSDTWNTVKIKRWREIFSEFILP